MAYSVSHTFVGAATMLASQLNSNNQDARDYLNTNIIAGDLAATTFEQEDFNLPEPMGVNDDVLLTTGDIFVNSVATPDCPDHKRQYHTNTLKQANPFGTTLYVSCPNLAKEIYLEDDADVMVSVIAYTEEKQNVNAQATISKASPSATYPMVDTRYYLAYNGVPVANTMTPAFSEDIRSGGTTITSISTHSSAILMNSAAKMAPVYSTQIRKVLSMQHMKKGLSQGWNQISVVCDPKNEHGYFGSCVFIVEVFYKGGYNKTTYSESGLHRSIANQNY